MNHITLQKVDESNFLACFSLKLEAQQEKFVSHPIRSLAQAYVYYSQCTPFAVCRAGQVVGYLMVIYDYDEEAYFIWHLMIDAQHQGRGCGRAAMEAALAYIRSKPFGASNLVRLTDAEVASHQIQFSGRQHLLHLLEQKCPTHEAVIGHSGIAAAADGEHIVT